VLRYSTLDEPVYFVHASLPEDGSERELAIIIKRKHKVARLFSSTGEVALSDSPSVKQPWKTRISGNPHFCMECDGLGYIFFAFDPAAAVPSDADAITSSELGISPDGQSLNTTELQQAIDQVSESVDLKHLVLEAGHYRIGDILLKSGVHLHLCSGAVLQASDRGADIGDPSMPGHGRGRACLVEAHGATDIGIIGHGHIDGNRSKLDLDRYFKGMMVLTGCSDVRIEGPIFSDACGWNTTPRHCRNVLVRRLKIMNNRPKTSCINTDGCNPDGCQNVHIDHCMFHTGDDAVAVKSTNYGGEAKDCCDIRVTDLIAVNNSSTAKIGTETMANRMERISFERIFAVRTTRLAALDAFDYAHLSDIRWTDCGVHFLDDDWVDAYLVDLQAPPETKAFRSIPAKATATKLRLEGIHSEGPAVARLWSRQDDGVDAITDVSASNLTAAGKSIKLEVVTQPLATN
jgi:hypothetical protein